MILMRRISISIFLVLGWLSCMACPGQEQVILPFPITSTWQAGSEGQGAAWVRAGRVGKAIVLEGKGSGLRSTASGYWFAAQTVRAFDRAITARLDSYSGPAGGSAGISIRKASLAGGGSVFMDLLYTPDGQLHLQGATWSRTAQPVSVAQITLPVWLQIEYRGGALIAGWSSDGIHWNKIGDALAGTLSQLARPMVTLASGSPEVSARAGFEGIWLSGADADDNGIFDGWEMKTFRRLIGDDAGKDLDGDSLSVLYEWLTGTSPFLPETPKRLSLLRNGDGGFLVSLDGAAIPWELEAADSLIGPWESLAQVYDIRSPVRLVPDNGKPARFFRASFLPGWSDDPLPSDLPAEP